jgi:protease I
MDKHKVLIIVGDATETVDTLYPYYRLIEGGYQPVVAGPEKRVYQMVMHEVKPGWKDIRPQEYAGIFFSGGRAPEYIREDQDLLRVTRWFWENKRPMASVCHGVEIPARAGIVKGLRMATVAKCKFDLEVCGGIYVNEPCVIDQHMFSGRTYHDHGSYIGPWVLQQNLGASPIISVGVSTTTYSLLSPKSREPQNTPNTRKHDITLGGFISVCLVCSVVKKNQVATHHGTTDLCF